MTSNSIIKTAYLVAVGILLAVFVGVGLNTFYEGPKYPEYPSELNNYDESKPTKHQVRLETKYSKKIEVYDRQSKDYSQIVSILSLVAALVLLAGSYMANKKSNLFTDSLLVGGISTLIYALIHGFISENAKYSFAIISIGLIVVGVVGYYRFNLASSANKKKQVRKK